MVYVRTPKVQLSHNYPELDRKWAFVFANLIFSHFVAN